MRSTVGRESTTFGFSILVTVTFGMLQVTLGSATVPKIAIYAMGAVLSFSLLEAALSRGFRRAMPQHHTQVLALGTAFNLVSVLLGLGSARLVAGLLDGWPAWLLAPFVAGVVYLLAESVEDALAERVLARAGDRDAAEVEP
jgi:hypothetical protein